MEYYLSLVEISLAKYEVSIHNNMHHEHSLLSSEISWVSEAKKIATGVKKAVGIDKEAISAEIYQLQIEYQDIVSIYGSFYIAIDKIEDAISQNIVQINNLKQEYNYIKTAKWQLYGYISAIRYEKGAVQIAINEVEKVVGQLNIQVANIYNKIYQLTKRQQWLLTWENKLYVDLEAFSQDIKRFRAVESDLVVRESNLYCEQERLKREVLNVRKAITDLRQEYQYIINYINYLELYEKEIVSIYGSVSGDASAFINAYKEFTCEDNLLYYEACSSSVAKAVVTPKPDHAKKVTNKHAVVVTDHVVVTNVVTQKNVVVHQYTNRYQVTNRYVVTGKGGYSKTTNVKTNMNGNRKLLASDAS
jgi:predicted  nucleic acid-binding Zn-ribbon protein